ncbi:MAG: alanyl-tRNA editing protein [Epulopiscium sp.]|jgi:alanyl-tRNA synthetase|nr:alanyl-tRNA editing protein [Candidatus Epulonipiscium sp.]HOQ16678.1 alanyl-tRNA editing protein [Defluviitaleaceae bacterium]HPT76180.1 alanyl-tRNA editing protein [Defluviitaleaceae bacterium]
MTKKCYYDDPYTSVWESEIVELIPKDDKYLVVLDKTYFYPEGGGQPSDTGTIEDIYVSYVFEEDGKIYHLMEKAPKEKKVQCKIDFEKRFTNMQQHTGEHLLAATFYKYYQGVSNAFHMGEDYTSIDISLSEVTPKMVKEIEDKVNEIIYKNVEVKTYLKDIEEAKKLPLRKQPKVDEDIRIVEIDGVDFCPCCGTHVKRTGEVGILKIIKTEKSKGATRIYFQCGRRAFEDYSKKHDVISTLNETFSANENTLLKKVEKYLEDVKEKENQIKELKKELVLYEAQKLLKNAEESVIYGQYDNKSMDEILFISKQVLQMGKYIFIGLSLKEMKLFIAHNTDFLIHCGNLIKSEVSKFGGKGGGSPIQAQAVFENQQDLLKCGQALLAICKSLEYA